MKKKGDFAHPFPVNLDTAIYLEHNHTVTKIHLLILHQSSAILPNSPLDCAHVVDIVEYESSDTMFESHRCWSRRPLTAGN